MEDKNVGKIKVENLFKGFIFEGLKMKQKNITPRWECYGREVVIERKTGVKKES